MDSAWLNYERRFFISRTYHYGKYSNKDKVDRIRKLGRAVIQLTEAQLEKEARAKHRKELKKKSKSKGSKSQ